MFPECCNNICKGNSFERIGRYVFYFFKFIKRCKDEERNVKWSAIINYRIPQKYSLKLSGFTRDFSFHRR